MTMLTTLPLRLMRAVLGLLLGLGGMVLPALAQVQSCSPYMGQAVINELRIGSSGNSATSNQVEIYNSGNVAQSVWSTWQLAIYYQRSGRTASKKGGYYLSSGFSAKGQFVYNSNKAIYLRNRSSRNVDIALVDAAGRFIDYIAIGSRIQTVPACLGTPRVVNAGSSSDTTGDLARSTDGGSWPASVSNTSRHTIGASNTCTQGASDLVVDIQAAPDNPIVNVTVTTWTITVSNKSCSNGVSNIVVTTTGISSTNFSGLTYVVSQGAYTHVGNVLTFNPSSLNAGASATLTVTGKPRLVGPLTAISVLTAPASGLVNPGDDSDSKTITVRDRNYVGFDLDAFTLTEGTDDSYSAVISSSLLAANPITIRYTVTGTATAADTDLAASGTLILDPTDPETPTSTAIDFLVKDDLILEPTKTIVLTITSVSSSDGQVALDPSAAVMTLTLEDDDIVGLDHLELRHASGQGVTCAPDALTVMACADAACALPYLSGVSGSLSSSQAAMLWPQTALFTIPAGSSSTTVAMRLPVASSSLLGVTGTVPAARSATSCNFGSPACTYSAADAALLAAVSHHVSDTAQTLTVQAVRKSDSNSGACVAGFAGLTRAVRFSCGYVNPASGSLPLRVGGKALNAANNAAAACDGSGQTLALAFNAQGLASTTLQYADAGQVDLGLLYTGSAATGDLGLSLAGSSRFIAAPASFSFPDITAGPIRAGTAFSATLQALNASGVATPNFGRESTPALPTLSFSRAQPTGAGASDGVFTSGGLGAFSAGQVTASALVWSEVGRGDVVASLANYLGSGLAVTGSTNGRLGSFVPHHFDVSAAPACGVFSYAGQPFRVTVTAKNGLASPGTTLNYDGSASTSPNFARATSLSETALGSAASLSGGSLAASLFRAGVASSSSPAVAYVNKLTAPQNAVLRAIDADGVSSAGFAEAVMPLRSGRLRLYNALGSEKQALTLPIQLQYWSGQAWLLNAADSCTLLPASAISAVSFLDHKGQATTAWTTGLAGMGTLSALNGQTSLSLAAPPAGKLGSVDLSINLGSTAADQSCLASHPASTGAALPWLRAQNGACATGWASDPSARASFGIYSAETRKTVHVREIF